MHKWDEEKMNAKTRTYDLEERLVRFAVSVIDVTDEIPVSRAGNHIANQLVRAGTSPASNYGEAESAESRSDFIHKMKVALKELKETRIWMQILFRKAYFRDSRKLQCAQVECNELVRIFAKSIGTAESNQGNADLRKPKKGDPKLGN
jgi:four helix bundle protein